MPRPWAGNLLGYSAIGLLAVGGAWLFSVRLLDSWIGRPDLAERLVPLGYGLPPWAIIAAYLGALVSTWWIAVAPGLSTTGSSTHAGMAALVVGAICGFVLFCVAYHADDPIRWVQWGSAYAVPLAAHALHSYFGRRQGSRSKT